MNFKLSVIARFLIVVVLITGSAFYVTGHALALAFPGLTPGWWGAWTWALALWGFPVVRVLFFRHGQVSRVQSAAFFMVGVGATLFILILLFKLAGLGLGLVGYHFALWTPWALLGLSLGLGLLGWQVALGPATVKTLRITKPGLAADLRGLRIVQISDVHISHLQGRSQVQRLVDQANALVPDLIAITGDLADGPGEALEDAVAPLASLRAPLGVFYVTGNHEYFWGAEDWKERFRGLGLRVLDNRGQRLSKGGASLLVLGVDDVSAARFGAGGGPDLERALAGAAPADFTLFLAHQPQAVGMAEAAGADLFLAGHTHGGQFLPFPPIVALFHRYFRGLYRHGDRLWVYVHPGSGFWGPPNRLGVPPEIAVLELEQA